LILLVFDAILVTGQCNESRRRGEPIKAHNLSTSDAM
jgi:hypothetical protein